MNIANKIEEICGQGCNQVNQILSDVQNGKNIHELNEFNHREQQQIVDELRQIMSVYDEG